MNNEDMIDAIKYGLDAMYGTVDEKTLANHTHIGSIYSADIHVSTLVPKNIPNEDTIDALREYMLRWNK